MSDIVLTAFNTKYAHCAFGLRYLMANLGELRASARLLEFDIHQQPLNVAEEVLQQKPKIVGIGVHVWNVAQCTELVADLRRLRPDLTVVLGGPEVSYETEQQAIAQLADHVITGEGDLVFAELCRELLVRAPLPHVIAAESPALERVLLPYDLYTDDDIAHRVIYVEASRGCPFGCEFYLSSFDIPVRYFLLEQFLAAMQLLLDRGARRFKFVDRSFNVDLHRATTILQFFLERARPGLNVHFEMVPDRFPDPLRDLVRQFPTGILRIEVGVQTFNDEVAARIGRRQNNAKAEANLRWLREKTEALIHADLVLGLPGETLESIAAGFDRLVSLRPQEIQVGILKRLRGAPIVRHDREWEMVYSPYPPYEILQNKLIDFFTMQRLKRFARFWENIWNSGAFTTTASLLWVDGSAFGNFLRFSDWLFTQVGQTHGIARPRLAALLERYLTEASGRSTADVACARQTDEMRTRQLRRSRQAQ